MNATDSAQLRAHQLVRQFLRLQGYETTLRAFQDEAVEVLATCPRDTQALTPLEDLLRETAERESGKRSAYSTAHGQVSLEDEQLMCLDASHLLQPESGPCKDHEFSSNVIATQTVAEPVRGIVTSHVDRVLRFTPLVCKAKQQGDLHDEALQQVQHALGAQDAVVLSMDVHPNRPHWLLTSSMDGAVAIIDLKAGQTMARWKDHTKYAVCARFIVAPTTNDDWMASAGHDGRLNIYRLASSAGDAVQDTAETTITVVADASGAGNRLSGSSAPYVLHKQHQFRTAIESFCTLPGAESQDSEDASDAADAPEVVIALRSDPYLRYLQLDSGHERRFSINADPLDTHVSFSILDLAVSPCGRYIAAATDKQPTGLVVVYARAQNRQVASWFVASVPAFSRSRCAWLGQRVVAALGDEHVYLLEVGCDAPRVAWPAHSAAVRCLAVDTELRHLVTGGFDSRLRTWSFAATEAT
ncbi:WD40-repeat-containing domain protein [Thamnocephalis sphaerospora]|uniref:WD40-repeat-containing domain protein n=1 Tax=Thamnocephalis sphaerospora TaxID=78915 RepID=A0A4P9XI52_9FUNG|nr:WD40-repeat-containing domain protein [Thamnocephalis sphaerospora]|eukprot:RKP05347.1 WD40-repeat-containing domain protein [Thamnocephalis sphaerospora]